MSNVERIETVNGDVSIRRCQVSVKTVNGDVQPGYRGQLIRFQVMLSR